MSFRFAVLSFTLALSACRAASPFPKAETLQSAPPAAFEDWIKAQREAVERDPQNGREIKRLIGMLAAEGQVEELEKLSPEAVAEMARTMAQASEATAPFKISRAELCRKISGYRRFVPYGDPKFKPGAILLVYVEMEGYRLRPWGDYQSLHVRYDWELYDGQGRRLSLPAWDKAAPEEKEDKIEFRGPVRDFHQSFGLPLPRNIPGGPYTLRITAEDQSNKKRDEIRLPLEIVFE